MSEYFTVALILGLIAVIATIVLDSSGPKRGSGDQGDESSDVSDGRRASPPGSDEY